MRKKGIFYLCLLFVLLTSFTIFAPVYADDLIAFDKNFTITSWHIHFSYNRFEVDNPGNGVLTVKKITPDKQINGGFILLNDDFVLLQDFLTGDETIFVKNAELRGTNHITVFLIGLPDASINIKISQEISSLPPEILSFTAEPSSIKLEETSLLSWQTENADSCMIEPDGSNLDPNGSISVSPTETTAYTLTATGDGDPVTATVIVTIDNSPPVAAAQTVTTEEDTEAPIRLIGSDIDGDSLIYIAASEPSHGILTGTPPDITYIPNANFSGTDEFLFIANDGTVDSGPAVVTIMVIPINDVPVADAGSDLTANKGDTVSLNGGGSSDVDGDALNYQWTFSSLPSGSTAALSDPSIVNPSFVPDVVGTFAVQLIVNDGTSDSAPDTALITADPRMVTVPDVVGQIQADALAALIGANLLVGTISTAYSDTIPADHIISQAPAAGATIVEGSAVDLVVSLGPVPPPAVTISADPLDIPDGGSSTLTWSSTNADSCSIDPGIGTVNTDGSISISPTTTTSYIIIATGPGGAASDTATVTVHPAPTVSISADRASIPLGESVNLTWSSTNAETISIEPGIGSVALSGSMPVSPTVTTTYTVTASNPGGSTTDSVVIEVIFPPSVTFNAGSTAINEGQSTNLSWTSTGGLDAHIDNNIGNVVLNDSVTVSPEHTTTYTFTVSGTGGTTSKSITIAVHGLADPQPEGSFGEKYEDLVPLDATIDQYDPDRFSLITGKVLNSGGAAISDVSITVHSHPEYGRIQTDTQGEFSIPVEGGGTLTIIYRKLGFLPAQRKVYVPWNDIAVVEEVVMIVQDPVSTTLTFDGNPANVVTAKSTDVTDEFGTRAFTLVLTGDNQAYLVDENGNDVHQLTTITTRATEYTTPESMPAKLPPTSAFTYCAELRVDGAERVRFEKPVIGWVDNFLGMPVGEIVPVGYYDKDKGVWVPEENGVVVQLLDTDTDGVVDALDTDGNGQPDDLDGDQSFSDEVQGLEDNQRYTAGSTFWRVAISHFTDWDCNWPFGSPFGARSSEVDVPPLADNKKQNGTDPQRHICSFVEEKSRIFHEDIPIPGTGMTLHYDSSRVAGYKPGVISVPVSGDTIPENLERIIVQVEVAGQNWEVDLPAEPNQTVEIDWNGQDHLGRLVDYPVNVFVKIGFIYHGVYYSPSRIGRAFGQPGISSLTVPTRQEVTLWKDIKIPIARGKGILSEGWTLSSHHQLSPMDPSTLFKGDGTISKNGINIIETYAGIGIGGYTGDDGPAVEARISNPYGLHSDAAGNLYIADYGNGRIRKVDAQGIITTALQTNTVDMAVDAAGIIYYPNGNNLWKYDPNGGSGRIAGDYQSGYLGDGGLAVNARLYAPRAVALDATGNIYIVDMNNYRIRKIDTAGIITTVAGNGILGHSGDGGPATEARLYYPRDVVVDSKGNIYITENSWVRKVDASGVITTVAGGGSYQDIGDGGPATEAYLSGVEALAIDATGNLYILENYTHRVRKVDTSGIITTVVGSVAGDSGSSGEGGLASDALLNTPRGLAVDAGGNIYISDTNNKRVGKVSPPVPALQGLMGATDIAFTEASGIAYIMSLAGLHKKTVDLNTGATLYEFGYDEENRLVSITDEFGNQITIESDTGGIPTAIISPYGVRTELNIDGNNHLIKIVYQDGNYYDFEYSTDGLLTLKTQPEGNQFGHVFDANGRITDFTDDEGGHWQFSRSVLENGDVLHETLTGESNLTSYLDSSSSIGAFTSTITDPSGAQTQFTSSDDGLAENTTLSCGQQLEIKYNLDSEYKFKYIEELKEIMPSSLQRITLNSRVYQDDNSDGIADRITDTITVNGKAATLEQNIAQTLKTSTSPEGRVVSSLYDPTTLAIQNLSIPGLYDTAFTYDLRGRITSQTTNTRQTIVSYVDNASGDQITITDPEQQLWIYNIDPMDRLSSIQGPDGGQLQFAYDKNGNMTVLTNPVDVAHGFGFNNVNLNSSYQTPLSGSYSYVYDKDRRLIQTNFPSGKTIINDYTDPTDPNNKSILWQIRTPEGNIDFTYLCGAKVESITKGTESITYGNDGKLVTSETIAGTLNQSLIFTYNNDFDVSGFTYAGSTTSFSYDNDGLLKGSGSFTITRNPNNGLPETVIGGTLNQTRTFNGYGEVESENLTVNSLNVASWSLIRNNNGRISNKSETVEGTTSNYVYTYDSVGRLLTVTKDSTPVEEYQYDLNGTRTYEMNSLRGISGRSYSYSDEDHLLSAGSVTYSYDPDGFLSIKTDGSDVTNCSYSSRGELLRVDLPDGRVIEYVHDPLGRRIAKKVDGVIFEKYLWMGLTQLLAVFDGSNNLLMRFEYADDRLPVAMTSNGVTYHLAGDQVGSLRAVADGAGNVVKRIDYDSFGNIIYDTDPTFEMLFGFAGGLHDRDTGLVRFGYRDYDPDIGRWTAKDPIGFAGGDADLYGYVLNDPINLIDPNGLIWVTVEKDHCGIKNTGTGFLNWLTRKIGTGWSGGLPMSHPSEWERMEREIIQEWQHDKDNPYEDSKHTIGARRRVRQKYMEKPNKPGLWDATTTHYWSPPSPDRTYVELPGAEITNDFNWYEPL